MSPTCVSLRPKLDFIGPTRRFSIPRSMYETMKATFSNPTSSHARAAGGQELAAVAGPPELELGELTAFQAFKRLAKNRRSRH